MTSTDVTNSVFLCPSDPLAGSHNTNCAGCVSSGDYRNLGVLGGEKTLRLADIRDGLAATVAASEYLVGGSISSPAKDRAAGKGVADRPPTALSSCVTPTHFPHDHARGRAYRWNEDGLGGWCNRHQNLCLAWGLWNGRDPILRERLFGLTNAEGNHGEDVK